MTYNLGSLVLIPEGEGRMFTAGDVTIAVFRTRDGQVYATEPWCPHRGGPLADGIVATDRVLCPLHGYAFDLTTGCALHRECGSINTYPIRIDDHGYMIVTIASGAARRGEGAHAGRAILSPQTSSLLPADV